MYPIGYHQPKTIQEAQELLSKMPEAKILAGGQTLIPTLKQRLASPGDVIDITRIGELRSISRDGNNVVIGAAVRHAEVATSPDVQGAIPALAYLASLIGDPHVRNMGTMGGSVANNDPAADYPGAVLGLKATVHTTRRAIAADDFFTGMFSTALDVDEIITRFSFPVPRRAAYAKFPNPASRYSMAGAFIAELADGSVRVAITGAGPCAFRSAAHEAALAKGISAASVKGIAVDPKNLNSDIHGSAEYRAQLVAVMVEEAVAKLSR